MQQFKEGEVIPFKALIPIPHKGQMNVSIVDTVKNAAVGPPLISFDVYADETLPALPANNTAFSVTMPNLTNGSCSEAGACVLQWWWTGGKGQTYESCVDFVLLQ